MKLIIKEYLSSLKEREELDAILPDLLSELGFNVYSRPGRGTRQYGVDVAAISPDKNDRKVYLFSIKKGDLDRADWDGTPQALRSSLNEIRDVYIPTCIPIEYKDLNIVICLVCGGDIKEAVQMEVRGYIRTNQTSTVTYEEWNGDRLADLILNGILREEMFPDPMRSHLRKATAMVEEPDVSYKHFRSLINAIAERPSKKPSSNISKVREINLCLWVLFTWAREVQNVEAPYRASEYAILRAWEILKDMFRGNGSIAIDSGTAFNGLVELHFTIWDELAKKILPHVGKRHAISTAIGSYSSLDINLKTYEILGRIALRGLWHAWAKNIDLTPSVLHVVENDPLNASAIQLFQFIDNNPTLLSPISDNQAIDIALALMLLGSHGGFTPAINSWIAALINRTCFSFQTHGGYPTHKTSYGELAKHPAEKNEQYRKEATGGSTLYPMLALWAHAYDGTDSLNELAEFQKEHLAHCNFQLWFPDSESEAGLYLGSDRHGDMLSDIPVDPKGIETIEYVMTECDANKNFDHLSAIELGHWPIVLIACRHYRLPIPPQIWLNLLPKKETATGSEPLQTVKQGFTDEGLSPNGQVILHE